jgi:hypothetical protein
MVYRGNRKSKTIAPDNIIGLGTAAGRDVPKTGDATSSQVVLGNDSRLSGDTPLSLYDAHTILASTADDTPAAITVGQQTIIGRITGGNIKALSVSEAKVLLDIDDAESAISGKAPTVHTHTEADITNLVSDLSGKWPLAYLDVPTSSAQMAVNRCYGANYSTLCTLTLPATSAVGSVMKVLGVGAGGFAIAQNALQLIQSGATVSTTGVTGSVSAAQGCCIEITCVVADTTWIVTSSVGSIVFT